LVDCSVEVVQNVVEKLQAATSVVFLLRLLGSMKEPGKIAITIGDLLSKMQGPI